MAICGAPRGAQAIEVTWQPVPGDKKAGRESSMRANQQLEPYVGERVHAFSPHCASGRAGGECERG